jgi:cytochrome c oxidase assembly protein subunit 15
MTSFGPQSTSTSTWIRRLALAGLLLCFVVVVLGAYVRLTAAGLGCPDWPGCYGHLTPIGAEQNAASQAAFPNTPLHVGKAWREMIHRYAASTLGFIIVIITAMAITARRERPVGIPYALLLLLTVVVQGALGMLTVTWQLKPLIVTLHLIFGLTTLSLLWWLWLSLRGRNRDSIRFNDRRAVASAYPTGDRPPRRLVLLALVLLGCQIALGGWTSSNYAAVACPDFPECQQSFWPEMDFKDAFVLWRGLGINYEGGVLQHPARVAIHFTHRLGALAATIALFVAALATLRWRPGRQNGARVAAFGVLAALVLQLFIGASMVMEGFPLALATAHNAGAALLLLSTLALFRLVRMS